MRPWLLVPALGFSCVFAAATAQTYTVTDLGTLSDYPYPSTYPTAINEAGQVTGYDNSNFAGPPGVPVHEAFLYRHGQMTALAGENSTGYAITGGGPRETASHGDDDARKLRVVGSAVLTPSTAPHAFLYEDHFLRDLGTLPGGGGSSATAINSLGEIAGSSFNADGAIEAVLYRHGNIVSLGILPGSTGSAATGINNGGDVVGSFYMPESADRAFVYHDGKIIALGTLPGAAGSHATAINDALQIAGTAYSLNFQFEHAFLWSKGRMFDLGLLPNGINSQANSINAGADIVGAAMVNTSPNPTSIAFLYSDGKMRDLNGMIPANSGWILSAATGINNRGQIVGNGLFNGVYAGFLLSPDCRDRRNKDCDFCKHEP